MHLLATPSSPKAHYCRSCQKQIRIGRSLVCPNCSLSYEAFRTKGLVGCEACYLAFAPRLEPLMRDYQKRTPGLRPGIRSPLRNSLAVARSQELREALLEKACEDSPAVDPSISITPKEGPFKKASSAPFLSLRLRVARNIAGVPFYDQLSLQEQERLRGLLLSEGSPLPSHLRKHGFSFPKDFFHQRLRLYTGDEDHLRISWQGRIVKTPSFLTSGPELENLCENLNTILGNLECLASLYETVWHEDYGYLTACPALAGAGIRFSVELSLPRLAAQKGDWLAGLSESGFEVRSPKQERFCSTERVQISLRTWPYGEAPLPLLKKLLTFARRLVEWDKRI